MTDDERFQIAILRALEEILDELKKANNRIDYMADKLSDLNVTVHDPH